jgi:hypothetical protein
VSSLTVRSVEEIKFARLTAVPPEGLTSMNSGVANASNLPLEKRYENVVLLWL